MGDMQSGFFNTKRGELVVFDSHAPVEWPGVRELLDNVGAIEATDLF